MEKKADRGKEDKTHETNRKQEARLEVNNHITYKYFKYFNQKSEIIKLESSFWCNGEHSGL